MNKRQYIKTCMDQPLPWLQQCIAHPAPGMNAMHLALLKIAARRKAEFWAMPVDIVSVTEYGLTQPLSQAIRCF